MASGITNRGRYYILRWAFQALDYPTNINVHLVTDAVSPTVDHNTLSEFTEISGGGYSEYNLTRNGTDFDVIQEQDSLDQAIIQVKDVTWTASGGPLPTSGGARWALLCNDDSNPSIIGWFDLVSNRQVSDGQDLTIQNMEIDASTP